MRLYVGNVAFSTTEESLRRLFEAYGTVEDVTLITDRQTGRPRGFGFVEMPNPEEAKAAIEAVDGTQHDGRTLKVNEARPRGERGGSGGRRPQRYDRW